MKIPSAHQLKGLDAYTIENQHIESIDLMERAASKVVGFILQYYPQKENPVFVFCGPGNNGGDGLAISRLLHEAGYKQIFTYLFNTGNSLSEDCHKNSERLRDMCPPVNFVEVKQQFEAPKLNKGDLIVDALFGTGTSHPLSGGFAALVKFINSTHGEVISVDMPSGLMCEDNTCTPHATIVRAKHTLTFQLPKLALLLPDNHPFVGNLHILDIGLSPQGIDELDTKYFILEDAQVKALLKQRNPVGHKGTFGHALLIAGKYGMAGAAILSARACLKSGLGKLTLHTPLRNNDILQISVPEAILHHDADECQFTSALNTAGYNAIAVGPGIGTSKKTALALIELISHTSIPTVIDADALNILSEHNGWLSQVPESSILTPHPKEMQRLAHCNEDSFSTLVEALNMARQHHLFVVLKGHPTAICTPDGQAFFSSAGNSGMATAGSGDVLTGIITSLLAQKYTPFQACVLGVYLHGLAGDIAAAELSEESVTASDIVAALPYAFRKIK